MGKMQGRKKRRRIKRGMGEGRREGREERREKVREKGRETGMEDVARGWEIRGERKEEEGEKEGTDRGKEKREGGKNRKRRKKGREGEARGWEKGEKGYDCGDLHCPLLPPRTKRNINGIFGSTFIMYALGRGGGGQEKAYVLYACENVDNYGRPLRFSSYYHQSWGRCAE